MRKLFALTLVLLLTLSLVGCFKNPLSPANQTQQVVEHNSVIKEVVDETVAEESIAETVIETEAVTDAPATGKDDKISEEKAKKIALDHAGLKESEVKHLFVELDHDDGILRYEIDFRQGKYEYDYEIDAKTGKILSYDKDIDD